MPSLLVLGGSHFVGRAAVAEGLARGWEVTTFHRGAGNPAQPEVRTLRGDRTDPAGVALLRGGAWDLVIDTWSGAPQAAAATAQLLSGHADRYAYVSSCSVYTAPPTPGAGEQDQVVDADTFGPDDGDYPALKRGAELAIAAAFGERALFARAGLILGPHENVGRLTWWLQRLARGGEVLCPGPPELPLQLIDARDLAAFLFTATAAGHGGPVNVISRRGHATMGSLLTACHAVAAPAQTRLTWVDPEVITAAGIAAWEELPIWLPASHAYAAMHDFDVRRAHDWGLRPRPVSDTVADTWAWMCALEAPPPLRSGLTAPGVSPAREHAVLTSWRARERWPGRPKTVK